MSNEPRWSRKVLQVTSSEIALVADRERVFGLGSVARRRYCGFRRTLGHCREQAPTERSAVFHARVGGCRQSRADARVSRAAGGSSLVERLAACWRIDERDGTSGGDVARLTIGNLDDHVIGRLQERAQANQRSLEGEIRHVLTERVNPRSRILQVRARVEQIASLTAGTPQTDSVALLREDRDR